MDTLYKTIACELKMLGEITYAASDYVHKCQFGGGTGTKLSQFVILLAQMSIIGV
jgi:hypothetical protein